jgi:hypothetical protein
MQKKIDLRCQEKYCAHTTIIQNSARLSGVATDGYLIVLALSTLTP